MSRVRQRPYLGALLFAGFAHCAGGAYAADSVGQSDRNKKPSLSPAAKASQHEEEVVVTAERRQSRIQDVPVAVSAFNAKTLEQHGVRRLHDLAGLLAGVNLPDQSWSTQAIFIRGVGTTRPIANPSVGIYVDDIYIPRTFGAGWFGSLPDIERIEVLRGPQGTLYGQSSSAGAVKFISSVPTQTRHGMADFGYGNFNAVEGRGYISGGLTKNLSASFSVADTRRDGPDYNATLGRHVGALSNDQMRAVFHYTPGTKTDVVLSFDYMHDRSDYRTADPLNVAGSKPYVTFSDINPQQRYDGGGVTLHVSRVLNNAITLKSITGYRRFHMYLPTDTDGQATYLSGFNQDLQQEQVSEEIQMLAKIGKRVTLTSGVLGYHENFDVDRWSWSKNAFSILRSASETATLAGYSQADIKILDSLTATLGVRVAHDWYGMDDAGYGSNVSGAVLANRFDVRGLHQGVLYAVPRIALNWHPIRDFLMYASFSQGRTPGGFTPAAGTAAIAAIPVQQEQVTAYEVGLKGSALHNVISGSLAWFYNDYKDYQASITNPVINGETVTGAVIQNAGRAHIYGVEFEMLARPVERFSIALSATYMHSAFDTFENPTHSDATNYVGQALPYIPSFSGSITGMYSIPFANGSEARLSVTGRHETSSYSTINSTRALTKFPAQTYMDAQAFYRLPWSQWTVSIEGRNLFNKAYVLPVSGAYAPASGLNGVSYAMPRTVIGRIRYDF